MVDEKQKRAIERAQKTAERQRKLLTKRKESHSEYSLSSSASSSDIFTRGTSTSQSTNDVTGTQHGSLEAWRTLEEIREDDGTASLDDGRASAVRGGDSLELGDGSVDDRQDGAEEDMSNSESAPTLLRSVSSSSAKSDAFVAHVSIDGNSHASSNSKRVDIPRLSLQEDSLGNSEGGDCSSSLHQYSVVSVTGSTKSQGSKRTVSFQMS